MLERIEVPDKFPAVGDVSGKRVVLTGAGRGLGELIAHALSRGGAKVALVARTARDLAEVAVALTGPTLQFAGDVRDPEFNNAVADQTVAAWGGVDVWIGNAGISPVVAGPLETEPEVWRDVIDVITVNVVAPGWFESPLADPWMRHRTVLNVDGGYLLA